MRCSFSKIATCKRIKKINLSPLLCPLYCHAANERKHNVTFQEASTVFGDRLAMTFADPDHSKNEERYLTFGLSKHNRLLVVSHTDRGDKTRIVSARLMDRKERRIYEEG